MLDDVALMTKMAAKKTAGVLGTIWRSMPSRSPGARRAELPVVGGGQGVVSQQAYSGACRHRHQCAGALAHHPAPDAGRRLPLLRGAEKLAHKFLPHEASEGEEHTAPIPDDLVAFEQQKIKGPFAPTLFCFTEIIVIALGTVQGEPGAAAVGGGGHRPADDGGVYGLVGLIVKLDDIGLHLLQSPMAVPLRRAVGQGLLVTAPRLMHLLALVGTIAMFMVGRHSGTRLAFVHHLIEGRRRRGYPACGGRRRPRAGDADPAQRRGRRGGRAGAGAGHDPGEQLKPAK